VGINWPAVGAGLNLALACDVRVAAESARFESRFLQLPIHPGGGHSWMLNQLVGPRVAAALYLFDQPISGREAERLGLALKCVTDEDLLLACQRLCQRLVVLLASGRLPGRCRGACSSPDRPACS
jgi:enoyl-CoA hydratase